MRDVVEQNFDLVDDRRVYVLTINIPKIFRVI